MSSLAHGSLLDLGTLGIRKPVTGLLFVDVPPEILAEEKEGMTSGKLPRTPAPLSLTPIRGQSFLPLLSSQSRCPWDMMHSGSHISTSSLMWIQSIQCHPLTPRLLSLIVQRKPKAKVCECEIKEGHRCAPTLPNGQCHCSAWNHSGPDLRPLTIPVSSLH